MIRKYTGRLSALSLLRTERHHSRRHSVEWCRGLPRLATNRSALTLNDVATLLNDISPHNAPVFEPKSIRDFDPATLEGFEAIECDSDEAFFDLFNKQLEICSYTLDLNAKDLDDPRTKAQIDAFGRILKTYSDVQTCSRLKEENHKNVLHIIEIHISHCFPPFDTRFFYGEEKLAVNFFDIRALELVYRILSMMLSVSAARPVFGVNWHRKLLPVLNSPDSRERDLVVKCLVQFYINFESMRDDIISCICEMMRNALNGSATPYCIRPVLCVILRILSNSIADIPKQWIDLITRRVLPVVRSEYLASFVFVYRKILELIFPTDPALPGIFFWYVWRYFPRHFYVNQSYIVDFMNMAIAQMDVNEFLHNAVRIGAIYRDFILSDNMRVTQAAMRIWLDPKILGRLENRKKIMIPMMRSAVSKVERTHWNSTTQQDATRVLEVMKGLDPMAYQDASCRNMQHQQEQTMVKWLFVMKTAVAVSEDREIAVKMEPVIKDAFKRKPPAFPPLNQNGPTVTARAKKTLTRREARLSMPRVTPPSLIPEIVCK